MTVMSSPEGSSSDVRAVSATADSAPGTAAPAARPGRHRLGRWPRSRWPSAAAWGLGLVVAFAANLRLSQTNATNSDGASQALQAWDMLHGNPLLRGWWVTDVSFYTTELPQYAAIELVRGLSADVMHVAGAMTYTLLAATAAFLAKGRATGPAGVTRALLAAGIMLAPQLGAGTQTLLLSPDHTGTGVPVLLGWLLIDRAPARWYVPAAVWLGLALTAIADAMTLFIAVIPLAAVCAFRVAQGALADRAQRNRVPANHTRTSQEPTGSARTCPARTCPARTCPARTGPARTGPAPTGLAPANRTRIRPEPLRRPGYELALLAAAVLAIPAALAATALIKAGGGWQVHGLATALAGAGRLAGNARLTGEGLLELFGANVFGAASAGVPLAVAFAVVHLVGVALAAAAVAVAARRIAPRTRPAGYPSRYSAGHPSDHRPADRVETLLLTGIVIDLAAYLVGVQAVNISSTREIAPVLPFAAVLAGRIIGDWLLRDRLPSSRHVTDRLPGRSGRLRPTLRYALCGVLALYAAMLGYAAAQPPAPPQYADLAAWLAAHHLTEGLSGYHQANIVTLQSGGAVILRAVTPETGDGKASKTSSTSKISRTSKISAYAWNASTRWFDPSLHAANFLVLTAPGLPDAAGGSAMTVAEAVATFGRPAEQYRYDAYTILIWPRGENLLARLSGAA
jgi:hypothetical protein